MAKRTQLLRRILLRTCRLRGVHQSYRPRMHSTYSSPSFEVQK